MCEGVRWGAEVVIARRGYEFWTGPYARRLQFAHVTEPDELAHLVTANNQGRLRLVEDTLDLVPGIELVVVGGHTPGQMVAQVAVDHPGGEGAVVLAADAVHFYRSWTATDRSPWSPTSPICTADSTCCGR